MKNFKSLMIKIAYCIVLVALIEPRYFTQTSLHNILGLVRYVAFAVAIPMVFYYRIYKDKVFLLLTALMAWIGISSMVYSHRLPETFLYNTRIMFTLLVFAGFGARKMPRFFVGSFAGMYALWLFLQGITWKQGGLYLNTNGQLTFFLGTKTSMTYYFIPGLLFILVYMEMTRFNKPLYSRIFFLMAVVGSTLYLTRQPISTAILCAALLAIGIYVVEKHPRIGKPVMKYGFTATGVICILFVYNIIQKMFSFIIVDLLNESLELNGRKQIWEQVLHYIYKRPILGYGYSSGIRFDVWQDYNTSTHNFYLFLIFSAGLIGLLIFLYAIWTIHKKLLGNINSRIVRYILLTLIIINIECITEECCFNAMYFSVLALASNVEYILPKRKKFNADLDMKFNFRE